MPYISDDLFDELKAKAARYKEVDDNDNLVGFYSAADELYKAADAVTYERYESEREEFRWREGK